MPRYLFLSLLLLCLDACLVFDAIAPSPSLSQGQVGSSGDAGLVDPGTGLPDGDPGPSGEQAPPDPTVPPDGPSGEPSASGPTGATAGSGGTHSVSGFVSGYFGTGLRIGSSLGELALSANGSFSYGSNVITDGASLAITVVAQPSEPAQRCSVGNGTIEEVRSAVTDVSIDCVSVANPPRLLFTDLLSGPKTTGDDNRGAYVTLYGTGFGASQGDSLLSVGGVPVAVKSWGAAGPARGLETIVFQVGAETPVGANDVALVVDGVPSNLLTYEVTASGSVRFAVAAPSDLQAQISAAQAGDVVYLRAGTYAETKAHGAGDIDQTIFLMSPALAAARPIAFVAYPGETVDIACPSSPIADSFATCGYFAIGALNGAGASSNKYVFAGLRFSGPTDRAFMMGGAMRFVGNSFLFENTDGCLLAPEWSPQFGYYNSRGSAMLGNLFAESGCHGVGSANDENLWDDFDFSWNEVAARSAFDHMGLTITTYDYSSGSPTHGNIRINGNLFKGPSPLLGNVGSSINIGLTRLPAAPEQEITISNNIFDHAGLMQLGLESNAQAARLRLWHNTFRNNTDSSGNEIRVFSDATVVEFRANVIVATAACFDYSVGTSAPTASLAEDNFFSCDGTQVAGYLPGVAADNTVERTTPIQVNYVPEAALVDAASVESVTHDYYGRSRRQGGAPDIGAVERYTP